jgi:hypothetical protein
MSVTVPMLVPFTVSWPPGLTESVMLEPDDTAAPSCSAALLVAPTPVACSPAEFTLMLHGLTTIVCPWASLLPDGKVEVTTAKSHEPKVVVPVAVLPPDAIENAGVVDVLVNASVVVPVVPKSGTPAVNVNGTFATAGAVAAVVGMTASDATTATGAGSPPPPPQAVRLAATTMADAQASSFFIGGSPFPRGTAEFSADYNKTCRV